MGKRCFFDETNSAICCKHRTYLFGAAKTNWFLRANELQINPTMGPKTRPPFGIELKTRESKNARQWP